MRYGSIIQVIDGDTKYPGVAKFGIALDWGSRGRRFKSCHSDHLMIIRTLSSKWGTGSDLSFASRISFRLKQQAGRHPNQMPPHLLSFSLLSFLPFSELSLSFLALKEFLYLRKQDPGQGLHLVERNAGSIVVVLLFRHSLSSVINLRKAHFPYIHDCASTMNRHPPFYPAIRKPLAVQRFSMALL